MKKILFLLLLLVPTVIALEPMDTNSPTTTLPIVDAGNLILEKATYDPSPAEPGKYVDVWITVQNFGNKNIENSWIKLDPSYPFYLTGSDNGIEEVKLLTSGREKVLEYRLRVDDQVVGGNYVLDLILCEDELCTTKIKTTQTTISVNTGGKPNLEIGLENSEIFTPGKLGEITVSAINRGKLGMKFLIIEIQESELFEIISPSRVYIGELNSDDFETEDFQIYLKPTTQNSQDIKVDIKVEYSDENFKEYTSIEKIEFKAYSLEDAQDMGLISGGKRNFEKITLLLIVFAGIIFYIRRRRKKKYA
tara:strand:+ start:6435 stop:7352 length:918 start_codon:yes stop_codon:yes gene_type:complete